MEVNKNRGLKIEDGSLTSILSNSFPDEELLRCKRARVRLKRRLLVLPWYREKYARQGNKLWRDLHNSAVLSD